LCAINSNQTSNWNNIYSFFQGVQTSEDNLSNFAIATTLLFLVATNIANYPNKIISAAIYQQR
jgi:hypothetical protein